MATGEAQFELGAYNTNLGFSDYAWEQLAELIGRLWDIRNGYNRYDESYDYRLQELKDVFDDIIQIFKGALHTTLTINKYMQVYSKLARLKQKWCENLDLRDMERRLFIHSKINELINALNVPTSFDIQQMMNSLPGAPASSSGHQQSRPSQPAMGVPASSRQATASQQSTIDHYFPRTAQPPAPNSYPMQPAESPKVQRKRSHQKQSTIDDYYQISKNMETDGIADLSAPNPPKMQRMADNSAKVMYRGRRRSPPDEPDSPPDSPPPVKRSRYHHDDGNTKM